MWMQSVKRGRVLAAALQGSRDALSEGGWPHNSRAVRLFYYIDVGWMDQKSYQHYAGLLNCASHPLFLKRGVINTVISKSMTH